jgi:hypothetical protein
MTYEEWEKAVPLEIKGDTVWRIEAYRLSLFAADLGWGDVTALSRDRRTLGLSDQLYRALGSMGANIEEGYSLLTMVPDQRGSMIREEAAEYAVADRTVINLLRDIPLL